MPEGENNFDIVIVGAALVGSSLACALANTDFKVALIDAAPVPIPNNHIDKDGRSIALALSSKKMFSAIGLWGKLAGDSVPIKNIHISDQGHFGATRLDSARYDVESFGYLVPADALINELNSRVDALNNISRIQPFAVSDIDNQNEVVTIQGNGETISTKLLIAADGANSFIRNSLNISTDEKSYEQSALVGCIDTEKPHQFTAFERFTDDGPLAFLPRKGNRCGFIWMNPTATANENLLLDDEAFKDKLQSAFGYRLGHLSNPTKRFAYPLSLLVSDQRVQGRVVLIGNAAQTLHPIAGQGLNLALRDIAELCEIFAKFPDLENIQTALHTYAEQRQPDIQNTIRFTDRLNFIFNADYPLLSKSRGLGLAMLGAIPILEERIVKQNLGALGSNASLLQGRAVSA